MAARQARVEVEKRASGQIRVRVVPQERGVRSEARRRRAFINSGEFPDERSGYGGLPRATEFGDKSKKLVREYASAIERKYTKDKCRFLTATFPTSVESNYEVIARWSAWITAQINQFLRDVAQGAAFVYVWEHQKRGCLHVHYLLAHRNPRCLRVVQRRFKRFWLRTLRTLSQKSGVDLFATSSGGSHRMTPHVVRTFVQPVRKSVARYLAKYLSKSTSKQTTKSALPPSRWWGANAMARSAYEQYTKRVVTALRPLCEATQIAEFLVSELSAAAVPIFRYSSAWSTGLQAWVVCISPEQSDGYFEALTTRSGLRFVEGDTIVRAVENQEPALASLADVALFFNGVALRRRGLSVVKVSPQELLTG